jgi:uncharacterized membrane protein
MRYGLTLSALAAVLFVGCNQSPEGGAPGNNNRGGFTISAPTLATTIKQDNSETVKISLSRDKDFKQNVKLSATAPDKIKAEFVDKATVTPADPNDVAMKITVAGDAPLGDHVIKVTGTPDTGAPTSVDVKVTVDSKK